MVPPALVAEVPVRCSWRSAATAAVFVLGSGSVSTAQNPSPASSYSTGHISSRFIPIETMNRLRERPEGVTDATPFSSPIDSVWAALKATLVSLEAPIGFEERSTWQIGNAEAKMYRYLGKNPLSSYLRCGDGPTGPNADSYVVYVSFLSALVPAKDTVSLITLLTGRAVDLAGGRNDPVQCSTTGRFESAVAKQMAKKLHLKEK